MASLVADAVAEVVALEDEEEADAAAAAVKLGADATVGRLLLGSGIVSEAAEDKGPLLLNLLPMP